MSDGESRQAIQQLLLTNCENVDSSLNAVSLASHASRRTPVVLRPGECIDFFFQPEWNMPLSRITKRSRPARLCRNRAATSCYIIEEPLLEGLTPTASRTRVYHGNLPRRGNWLCRDSSTSIFVNPPTLFSLLAV